MSVLCGRAFVVFRVAPMTTIFVRGACLPAEQEHHSLYSAMPVTTDAEMN